MKLTDLLPLEGWEALEREIVERFGLNAAVTDLNGARITTFSNFCNTLCQRIKTDPRGGPAICAVASQHFASHARETLSPLLEECDAGMTKIAAAIVVQGKALGTVGCCGVLVDDAEVDEFMVARSLGIDESELAPFLATIPRMSQTRAEEIQAWLVARVEQLAASR